MHVFCVDDPRWTAIARESTFSKELNCAKYPISTYGSMVQKPKFDPNIEESIMQGRYLQVWF